MPDQMAQQSVAARGLAGLERLLFPTDPLAADPCPLIQATVDDMAQIARDLATERAPSATCSCPPVSPATPAS